MKDLSEMTLDELWQLFPIVLSEHNPEWFVWYDEEKENLLGLLGTLIERIDHIGSTSIPGLLSKPTVDILVQTTNDANTEHIKAMLLSDGWRLMAENNNALDFNKGYTPDGFADRVFHLHVRPAGEHDEIYFRDYIATHPDAAAQYAVLKRSLFPEYKHNRDGYTEAKGEFIKETMKKARDELNSNSLGLIPIGSKQEIPDVLMLDAITAHVKLIQ